MPALRLRTRLPRLVAHAVEQFRRDDLTRQSNDESRQLELCRYMWWLRHLTVAVGLVVAVSGGATGRTVLVISAMLAWQVGGHLLSHRRPAHAGRVAVVDSFVLFGLTWLGLPSLLVLVLAVATLGWAATFRPLPAVATLAMVMSTAMVMHARSVGSTPEQDAQAMMISWGLLAVIFMMRTIRLNIGARRAAERERTVSDGIDAILWETSAGQPGMRVSGAAQRLLGYPVADWTEQDFWQSVVHPDDQFRAALAPTPAGQDPVVFRVRHADGSWRWVENRVRAVSDRRGREAFVVGVLLDRTHQVETERDALAFGHLVSSSPIGQLLLQCTAEDAITIDAMNPACHQLLGVERDAVGEDLAQHVVDGFTIPQLLDAMDQPLRSAGIEFTGRDGRTYQAVPRRIDAHSCKVDFIDVTERVETGRLLHAQARQDELTGLPNRRAFLEALGDRLRVAADAPTGLLMLDLDDFKDINDSLGHQIGDGLLKTVAAMVSEAAGPDRLVARLGGDEFAIIVPDASPHMAGQVADGIAETINGTVQVADLRLHVRTSIGVAAYPDDAHDVSDLVRRADIAMYQAKTRGTQTHRYDPANDGVDTERVMLLGDLHGAVAEDQLVLFHQPLIDLDRGRVVGTEALVRWRHPTLGLVPPGRFIELAEVSGQIKDLTRWVIRQALQDARDLGRGPWPDGGPEVSVNLSVRNLYEPDLLSWLEGTLHEAGVDGSRLVVELTESTVMGDQAAAVEVMHGLRDLGVRTWIDDFGTGHSSLARLRSLPVHGVKIDRSFVTAAARSANDRSVLRSLIELVRTLGLTTIAEGVEDPECVGLLRDLGCDLAQGFYFGGPIPASAWPGYLRGHSEVGAVPLAPVRSGARATPATPAAARRPGFAAAVSRASTC